MKGGLAVLVHKDCHNKSLSTALFCRHVARPVGYIEEFHKH